MNSNGIPMHLRLLSLVAHPHDITYTLGTSANHIERGDSVTAVSITNGVKTHDVEVEDGLFESSEKQHADILQRYPEEQAEKKKNEMIEACGLFGISDVRVLPFTDQPIVPSEELLQSLIKIFYEIRPHIVMTMAPFFPTYKGHASLFCNDHVLTGQIVQEAMERVEQADPQRKEAPHRVAEVYYIGVEFGWNEIDLSVDIKKHAHKRMKAEELYHTQGHTPEMAQKRIEIFAGYAGWFSGTSYAEPFIRSKGQSSDYLIVTENDLSEAESTGKEMVERRSCMVRPDF